MSAFSWFLILKNTFNLALMLVFLRDIVVAYEISIAHFSQLSSQCDSLNMWLN